MYALIYPLIEKALLKKLCANALGFILVHVPKRCEETLKRR